MPAKTVKLQSGTKVEIVSIKLANGNLLIPSRHTDDRTRATWAEVEPGSSDYKRWLPVAEDRPDPREAA